MDTEHFAALLGFGFVAVWAGVGFGSALLCLAAAAVCYVAVRSVGGGLDVADLRSRVEGARAGFSRRGGPPPPPRVH